MTKGVRCSNARPYRPQRALRLCLQSNCVAQRHRMNCPNLEFVYGKTTPVVVCPCAAIAPVHGYAKTRYDVTGQIASTSPLLLGNTPLRSVRTTYEASLTQGTNLHSRSVVSDGFALAQMFGCTISKTVNQHPVPRRIYASCTMPSFGGRCMGSPPSLSYHLAGYRNRPLTLPIAVRR